MNIKNQDNFASFEDAVRTSLISAITAFVKKSETRKTNGSLNEGEYEINTLLGEKDCYTDILWCDERGNCKVLWDNDESCFICELSTIDLLVIADCIFEK